MDGVSVCVRSCHLEGGEEQMGGGHSLNEWGKVGVEIVCFVCSLLLVWRKALFWGVRIVQ